MNSFTFAYSSNAHELYETLVNWWVKRTFGISFVIQFTSSNTSHRLVHGVPFLLMAFPHSTHVHTSGDGAVHQFIATNFMLSVECQTPNVYSCTNASPCGQMARFAFSSLQTIIYEHACCRIRPKTSISFPPKTCACILQPIVFAILLPLFGKKWIFFKGNWVNKYVFMVVLEISAWQQYSLLIHSFIWNSSHSKLNAHHTAYINVFRVRNMVAVVYVFVFGCHRSTNGSKRTPKMIE